MFSRHYLDLHRCRFSILRLDGDGSCALLHTLDDSVLVDGSHLFVAGFPCKRGYGGIGINRRCQSQRLAFFQLDRSGFVQLHLRRYSGINHLDFYSGLLRMSRGDGTA